MLIGSGIAVAGAAALETAYHYTTKYLMKLALDREGPKSAANDISREKYRSAQTPIPAWMPCGSARLLFSLFTVQTTISCP